MHKQSCLDQPKALSFLKEIADKEGWQKIFLVTGRSSYSASGAKESIEQQFEQAQLAQFCNFDTNPKLEQVYAGLEELRRFKPDLIVGIGGGTAMDMAKLVKAFANTEGDLAHYIRGEAALSVSELPLVCVPTTAGSGSEATHFAVVYDKGKKYSLAHAALLPDYAILDADLTQSLSPYIRAYTGFDALCQALESYWSVTASQESRSYAREAVALVLKHLPKALRKPDAENRRGMQEAAYLAGKAINMTKTTAAHAYSYYLTSTWGLPHGHAVALMFGWVYNENLAADVEACKDIAGFFGVANPADFASEFYRFVQDSGLALDAVDINEERAEALLRSVNTERLGNNPARINMTAKDLSAVFMNNCSFHKLRGTKEY